MEALSRCFPYEKSIIINGLYDTLEALGLRLDSANSSRGTLIVTDAQGRGKLRIALGLGLNTEQTRVEVAVDETDGAIIQEWQPIILDELAGMLQRCAVLRREMEG